MAFRVDCSINSRMWEINVSKLNSQPEDRPSCAVLTVSIRCMNNKNECSQLAYWIGTPAVNAAQSGVQPLVNAILDFQKLKILTSGPVRRTGSEAQYSSSLSPRRSWQRDIARYFYVKNRKIPPPPHKLARRSGVTAHNIRSQCSTVVLTLL